MQETGDERRGDVADQRAPPRGGGVTETLRASAPRLGGDPYNRGTEQGFGGFLRPSDSSASADAPATQPRPLLPHSTDAPAPDPVPSPDAVAAWTPADADQLYHVQAWGDGYFHINDAGHLAARPVHGEPGSIDLFQVVQELEAAGQDFPVLIRLQDILRSRVGELNRAFAGSIQEAGYEGRYVSVYPIKVNQLHEVVEEILEAGRPFGCGLECGSKTELMATLPHLEDDETLLVCNGYKDAQMLRLMLRFQDLGKNVMPVVEKYSEYEALMRLAAEEQVATQFGLRVRLSTVAPGKWAESGGDHSKFGVPVPELLRIVDQLAEADQLDAFRLLHFHLGSQISDIQGLKAGVKEITRIYAHLHRRGVPIRYLDVGGGLGINYDAGSTPGEGGISYSVEEYANAIVYSVLDVCRNEGVPQPTLITENGRALTAHHSVLVVEVLGRNTKLQAPVTYMPPEDAHPVVQLLYDMWQDLRQPMEPDEPQRLGRLLEAYHDAVEQRQTADSLFAFGYLDLDQKAHAEQLYWSVCTAINERVHGLSPEWLPAELDHLDDHLVDQYLCDFSVFQSMMDYWSIGQRFPILPLHRLDEEPVRRATLVDLTCDSDGKVNRFVSPTGEKRYLEVHPLQRDGRYFLAICLMGAYQDILGDNHNLFGSVSEVHVYADDEEPHGYFIENTIPGTTVQEMLGRVQYFPQDLLRRTQELIQKKTAAGKLRPKEGKALLDQYRAAFDAYTYLSPEPAVRAERTTLRAASPTNGHAPSTD